MIHQTKQIGCRTVFAFSLISPKKLAFFFWSFYDFFFLAPPLFFPLGAVSRPRRIRLVLGMVLRWGEGGTFLWAPSSSPRFWGFWGFGFLVWWGCLGPAVNLNNFLFPFIPSTKKRRWGGRASPRGVFFFPFLGLYDNFLNVSSLLNPLPRAWGFKSPTIFTSTWFWRW